MCESRRAGAQLTVEECDGSSNKNLHPFLSPVNERAQHVYNQDESLSFRVFLVNIEKVWAYNGRRWVAISSGYDPTDRTAMVCATTA